MADLGSVDLSGIDWVIVGRESGPHAPEPDLRPLRDWILNRLSRRPERWQDLHDAVRPEWWLPKHVNELVRELKKEAIVTADEVPRVACQP